MAPSVSTELTAGSQAKLLTIARDSIQHGLANSSSLRVSVEELPEVLLVQRGVFVTLTLEQKLRGCIGNMAATDPLPVAVSDAAFSAAFRDPRFTPLEAEELPQTRIEISVLSPSEMDWYCVTGDTGPHSCPRSGSNFRWRTHSWSNCCTRLDCRAITGRRPCVSSDITPPASANRYNP
jgi:hypothetical protein